MSEAHYFEFGLPSAMEHSWRAPVTELNLEILEAHTAEVAGLRSSWQALDAEARLRLAACPFLLIEAGFAQPQLWTKLPLYAVHEALPLRTLLGNRSVLPTP